LDARDSLFVELCVAALRAGNSVISLVAYIKEAAPETSRDTNLSHLIGLATALRTGVSLRERIRKGHKAKAMTLHSRFQLAMPDPSSKANTETSSL